jgi:hypothetical protein
LPLNRTLQLLQEDYLEPKKFSRAIHSIGVKRHGSGSVIVFSTIAPGAANLTGLRLSRQQRFIPYLHDTRLFHVDTEGNLRMSPRTSRPATLNQFPVVLQTRIFKYSLSDHEPTNLSLEAAPAIIRALQPIFSGPLLFDKASLADQSATYLPVNKFVIQHKLKYKAGQLDRFDRPCKLLWTVHYPKSHIGTCDITWPLIQYWPSVTINIVFVLQDPSLTSLEDVCFDAMPLLLATLCIMPEKRFIVHLRNSDNTGVRITQTKNLIFLHELRSTMLKAWRYIKPQVSDATTEKPQMWINGPGTVFNIVPVRSGTSGLNGNLARYFHEHMANQPM